MTFGTLVNSSSSNWLIYYIELNLFEKKDIVLFNSAETSYSSHREIYNICVHFDGLVTWMVIILNNRNVLIWIKIKYFQFPDIMKSYCRVDIKYFPFDK